jgi:hypothetical protein
MRVRLLVGTVAIGAAAFGTPTLLTTGSVTAVASCSGYINSDGQCILDPEQEPPGAGAPSNATAICRDGDYSFSTHHSGTCSDHGGVSQWLSN